MSAGGGDGDDGVGGMGFGDQVWQKTFVDEGEIHGEHEVVIGNRCGQRGMDSAEGAAAGIDVGDDRGEGGELFGFADNFHVGSDGAGEIEGAGEQGAPSGFEEGLIGAHAGAFSAGQDEGGDGEHVKIILGATD